MLVTIDHHIGNHLFLLQLIVTLKTIYSYNHPLHWKLSILIIDHNTENYLFLRSIITFLRSIMTLETVHACYSWLQHWPLSTLIDYNHGDVTPDCETCVIVLFKWSISDYMSISLSVPLYASTTWVWRLFPE